jgi:hypothetical protein
VHKARDDAEAESITVLQRGMFISMLEANYRKMHCIFQPLVSLGLVCMRISADLISTFLSKRGVFEVMSASVLV